MNAQAAHLVDHVHPDAPVRQWVLTVPFAIRGLVAFDPALASLLRRVYMQELLGFIESSLESPLASGPRGGAVTFSHRVDGALRINPHFHSIVLDGVYDTAEQPRFHELPLLTLHDLESILSLLVERFVAALRRLGRLPGADKGEESSDQHCMPDEALLLQLAASRAAATSQASALGRGNEWIEELGRDELSSCGTDSSRHSVRLHGFSLYASPAIAGCAADSRERLARYIARPPIAAGTRWREGLAELWNRLRRTTTETPSSNPISPKLHRIAEMAREHPERAFTNLAHHIDIDWLREAFRQTPKSGAVGVDGVTAEEYCADLERNLQGLLDRFKSDTYRAPAVRRVHIPKGDGRTRPLGIPSFEDKVLQRAVAMLLNAVYEQDFMDCSYGFRPRRSGHQALDRLWKATMNRGGGWVLEADIRDCFGTLAHDWMRKILSRRIRDGVLVRQINKWLKAGILEDGRLQTPTAGTPQGGVVSPVLANVYLHDVLDMWIEQTVPPRLRGRADLVRYADDFVIVFEHESDARRV